MLILRHQIYFLKNKANITPFGHIILLTYEGTNCAHFYLGCMRMAEANQNPKTRQASLVHSE